MGSPVDGALGVTPGKAPTGGGPVSPGTRPKAWAGWPGACQKPPKPHLVDPATPKGRSLEVRFGRPFLERPRLTGPNPWAGPRLGVLILNYPGPENPK